MSSSEWKTRKLRDVCTKIGSGATPRGGKETYLDEGPYALIRSQNVLDFSFSYDGLAYIDDEQARQLANVEVQERDVLLNITGDSVARVCQVPEKLLPARVNQHVSIVRPDFSQLLPEYLKYFLLNPRFKDYMLGLASVGGTRNALTKGMIEDFEIPIPPLPTQRRIADILSALDEKIELNRQTNATLEAIAQAIFKEWFVDFNFPGATGEMVESELGPIPSGWRIVQVGDVVDVRRGASPRPIHEYMGGEIPWLKIADATESGAPFILRTKESVTASGAQKSVSVVPGDLILSNSATCGLPFFVDLHGCVHDGWLLFSNYRSVSKLYLYHHFLVISEHLIHIADGSVQKNLNTNLVSTQRIALPNNELIKAFDKTILPIFEQIKENLRESQVLESLRNNLLPKLMNGEIDV